MLLTGLTRRFRGVAVADGPSEPLIGSHERIVPCPGCSRPLAAGEGRCLGCGSFLVAGVLLRTAGFLMLVGSVVGMVGGAVIAGVAMSPRLAAGDAAIAAVAAGAGDPVVVPVATLGPGTGGTAPPVPSPAVLSPAGLPDGVAAGLLQAAAVNDRLAAAALALGAALDPKAPATAEVATLLRRISADARSGGDAARRLGGWAPGATFANDAGSFYAAVQAMATQGLAAPLSDERAMAAGGRRVLEALAGLPGLAAATHDTAGLAGIQLLPAPAQ